MYAIRRSLLLAGLVAGCLLAFPATALAAAPSVAAVSPADAARFTGGFTVSWTASDPDGLNGTAATVSIGSATYSPAVSYSGYWEGDGCDTWFVEDRTAASFTCAIPDPGPGVYSLTIRVPDVVGEVAVVSRTVTRTVNLTFADKSPSPGGRYCSANDLMIVVTGGPVSASAVSVLLDGTAVPVAVQSVTPGYVTISADCAFTSGTHTISASVGDGSGSPPATTSWSFTINPLATPPALGTSQPLPGTTVQGAFQLRYHVTDPNGVDGANARVVCGGRVYRASVVYAGYWTGNGCDTWWQEDRRSADLTFDIPDLAPGSHDFLLEVPDAAGDWATSITTLLRSASIVASAQTPSEGSRNAAVSRTSVLLSGGQIDPDSVRMSIDGAEVPAEIAPVTGGTSVSATATLAEGAHRVAVSASDMAGSPAMTTQWTFVVDATAPAVVSVSPAEGSVLTAADAGIEVRLTDADAIDAASASLSIDGTAASVIFTPDATGGQLRWAGTLSEGPHEARVSARDVAGNQVSKTWTFTVADPPRFGAVSPGASPVGEDVVFSVAVSDVNDDLDPAVRAVVDGAEVGCVLRSSGTRSGALEVPLTGLADGAHTAVVYVRDSAGNEANKQWEFSVDAAAPALQSSAPKADSVLANHTVTLSAVFADASAIAPSSAKAWIDGSPVSIQSQNDTRWVGSGCDAYEEVVPQRLLVGGTFALHDGSHTVRVTATDAFGHEAQAEWAFTVAEYPTIGSLRPVPGVHTMNPSVEVGCTLADYDGIASATVDWRAAGGAWQPLQSTFDGATGALAATFEFPAGDTGYEFRITATDSGGLVRTATTSAYADGSGPVFDDASLSPKSGTTLTNRSVAFHGRFTDSSTIDPTKAAVSIDGQAVPFVARHETQWVGSGCDSYEVELPETLVIDGTATLHDGAHTLRLVSADMFGFPTFHESTFLVQEPPKIAEIAPVASSRTTEASYVVSARLTDYDGIASTQLSWREANTGRPAGEWKTAAASYDAASGLLNSTFTFPRNDTRYEFRFTATDSGGLVSTASTSIFASSTVARIEAGTDCKSCHTGILQTHPMTNCAACHGDSRGPCSCHMTSVHPASWMDSMQFEDHGGGYTGRTCTDCHGHDSDTEAQRHASGLETTCSRCHQQSLTAEHQKFTVDGQPFTCSTCHTSQNATVTAAIAAGDASCAACHPTGSKHVELHEGKPATGAVPVFDDHFGASYSRVVDCSMCHASMNLLAIHANDCDACHAGAKPADSFDAWNGSCQQGACHPVVAHAPAAPAHALIANDSCESPCHEMPYWKVPNSQCDACHDPASAAPVTSTDVKPSYTLPATIRLTAPGVTYTFYRLDGGDRRTGKSVSVPVPASGSQTHTLEYWSVNDAGFEELPHKTVTFTMTADTVPPTSIAAGPAYDRSTSATRVYFYASDAAPSSGLAGIYVSVNGGPAAIMSWYDITTQGVFTFRYWAVDKAGNAEVPKTKVVTKDYTPPETTSDALSSYTGPASIRLTATDGVSGVADTYYTIDGGAQTKGTSISVSAVGTHTLSFWSTDKAGNAEVAKSVSFTVN